MEAVLTNVQIPMGPFIVHAIMSLFLLKMIDTNALVSDFFSLFFICYMFICSMFVPFTSFPLAYYSHR